MLNPGLQSPSTCGTHDECVTSTPSLHLPQRLTNDLGTWRLIVVWPQDRWNRTYSHSGVIDERSGVRTLYRANARCREWTHGSSTWNRRYWNLCQTTLYSLTNCRWWIQTMLPLAQMCDSTPQGGPWLVWSAYYACMLSKGTVQVILVFIRDCDYQSLS